MPIVLRYKGYRLFFFSNEGNPLEPAHIHVRSGARVAKFWIDPDIILADSYEMNPTELKEIEQVVRENQSVIKEAWHDNFSGHSSS